MKFDKIIGNTDSQRIKEAIKKAEENLTACFTELSLTVDNRSVGSRLGGSPLTFQLLMTTKQIADTSAMMADEYDQKEEQGTLSEDDKKLKALLKGKLLTTCATTGSTIYYNPDFVAKRTRIGCRLICEHEASHCIYSHPERRGSRNPGLYNIAIDLKVNFNLLQDLRARGVYDPQAMFKEHLGDYITLPEYARYLKDPFNPPKKLAHLNPIHSLRKMANSGYNHPGDNTPPMYYADYNLPPDMKMPEHIYSYLLSLMPKCPKCGKIGMYRKPKEAKELEKQIADKKGTNVSTTCH
jgi:hypothetical protein